MEDSVNVSVEFLADDAEKAVRRRDVIVIVDALRCTTTIVAALANGAEAIIPVETMGEALRIHSENPDYLLAGERGGLKPRGFDLGNSPLEYVHERICGKTIILTTTSGTVALARSRNARWVLIGSFLNAGAVAKRTVLIAEDKGADVSIVQSGTKGRFSLEDFLCTGAIISRMPKNSVELSDAAQAALLAFKHAENDLCGNLMNSEHSRELVKLGFGGDIEFACQLDLFPVVPVCESGIITKK